MTDTKPLDPHHSRRWLILGVIALAQLDGGARRDDREHRPALRAGGPRLLRRRPAVGRSPPTPSPSAACCCSAAGSATCSAASGPSSSASLGFAGASALGGAATSFEVLIAARPCRARSPRCSRPAALSLLTTTFTDPASAARRSASTARSPAPARAVGLLLGGVLTEFLDWRWTHLREPRLRRPRRDRRDSSARQPCARPSARGSTCPASLLATAGLFSLVYGFANAEMDGWSAPADARDCSPSASRCIAAFVAGRAPRLQPAAAAARRARPQPRRRRSWPSGSPAIGDVRHLPVPHLLPPAEPGLLADPDRARLPADGRRDHGHGDDRVDAGSSPASARGRWSRRHGAGRGRPGAC